MIPRNNELYIEVIGGGGLGETIIIRLPDGRYGLIDCYSPVAPKPANNATVKRLRDLNVENLEFVALTHPHSDHFLGMNQVLTELPPKEFWLFSGATKAMLGALPYYLRTEALQLKGKNDGRAVVNLKKTLKWVNDNVDSSKVELKYLTGYQQLLSFPITVDGVEHPFSIQSIAPNASVVRRYEASLLERCKSLPPDVKDGLDHNDLSAAFLITFGRTRVLLGGDVGEETWRAMLAKQQNNRINLSEISFVKISHHGSITGYCDGFWPMLSQTGPPLAGLTPYTSVLPQAEAMNHIAQHTSAIAATGIAKDNAVAEHLVRFPAGTPAYVSDVTRTIANSAVPKDRRGSVALSIDASGTVTGPDLAGGALIVSGNIATTTVPTKPAR